MTLKGERDVVSVYLNLVWERQFCKYKYRELVLNAENVQLPCKSARYQKVE